MKNNDNYKPWEYRPIKTTENGFCLIDGFYSRIEKNVLHYLLKVKEPVILVLARGLKEKVEPEFEKPITKIQ